jgi:hypothetical protein
MRTQLSRVCLLSLHTPRRPQIEVAPGSSRDRANIALPLSNNASMVCTLCQALCCLPFLLIYTARPCPLLSNKSNLPHICLQQEGLPSC